MKTNKSSPAAEPGKEFERMRELTRRIIGVPKSEIVKPKRRKIAKRNRGT